jgi:adhesin transport system membrane fusion protein
MAEPTTSLFETNGRLPPSHMIPPPVSARRVARVIAVGLVLAVCALGFAPWRQNVEGEGRVVAYAPLDRRQDIEAPIGGRIEAVHVMEGTVVAEGDPLVVIADNDPDILRRMSAERAALELRLVSYRERAELMRTRVVSVSTSQESLVVGAQARIAIAEQRVESARQTLAAARASLETALLQESRQARLANEGLVSARELELTTLATAKGRADVASAEAGERAARSDLDNARATLGAARADATAREQEAEAAFEAAEVDVAGALAAIERLDIGVARQNNQIVRAPRAGTVYRVLVRQGGEQVSMGTPLVTLVPRDVTPAAEIEVDGNDAPLVTEGRAVRVQFEGWPAVQFVGWPGIAAGTFAGRVAIVDQADDGDGNFRVLVVPDPAGPRWPSSRLLRQGVRARAFVLLDEVSLGFEVWRRVNGFPPSLSRPYTYEETRR